MMVRVSARRRAGRAGIVRGCAPRKGWRCRHWGFFGSGTDWTVGGASRRDLVRASGGERDETCKADDDEGDLKTPHGRDLQRR